MSITNLKFFKIIYDFLIRVYVRFLLKVCWRYYKLVKIKIQLNYDYFKYFKISYEKSLTIIEKSIIIYYNTDTTTKEVL